jgi:hypothetical protein
VAGGEGGHRKAVVVLTSERRGELWDRVERVRRVGRRPWRGVAACAARCVKRGDSKIELTLVLLKIILFRHLQIAQQTAATQTQIKFLIFLD